MTREGEAISGTSKAGGMKVLWHREQLSNTSSLIEPTLGLITSRRKEQLDRKMERQKECKHECEGEKHKRNTNHMSRIERDEYREENKKYTAQERLTGCNT